MEKDFQAFHALVEKGALTPSGKPFSMYHKFDPVKNLCEYTLGIPVDGAPVDLAERFLTGDLPTCRTYSIRHTGPYRHLGNAWSAGMMRQRAKVLLPDKNLAPFEVYESDPKATPETDIVTVVHFPLK